MHFRGFWRQHQKIFLKGVERLDCPGGQIGIVASNEQISCQCRRRLPIRPWPSQFAHAGEIHSFCMSSSNKTEYSFSHLYVSLFLRSYKGTRWWRSKKSCYFSYFQGWILSSSKPNLYPKVWFYSFVGYVIAFACQH